MFESIINPSLTGCSQKGVTFVIGFINMNPLTLTCDEIPPRVYLTSTETTNVVIRGWHDFTIQVIVDGSGRVDLPSVDTIPQLSSNRTVSDYRVEITSDTPITVVAVVTCEEDTVADTCIDIGESDGTQVYPEYVK